MSKIKKCLPVFVIAVLISAAASISVLADEGSEKVTLDAAMTLPSSTPNWPSLTRELLGEIPYKNHSLSVILLEGKDAEEQIASFNRDIEKGELSGSITYCRRVIEIPVGRVQGNRSYGGLCLFEGKEKKAERVMVCSDVMVGRFKVVPLEEYKDKVFYLSKFVIDNCFGG